MNPPAPPGPSGPPGPPGPPPVSAAADRALRLLFALNRHAPPVLAAVRRPALAAAWMASPALRRGPLINAARVLGPGASAAARTTLARATVASFYDFVAGLGRAQRDPADQLAARTTVVRGADAYRAARAAGRGAVLVTAHLGDFEGGLAEVRKIEPRVHVVFRRDRAGAFEAARADLHRRLGVHETPIDDGLSSWLALRDALQNNGVVLLQGDRAEAGQKHLDAPFLGGHLRVPVGPAKLALMTGAPLIPVFALRTPAGAVHVELHEPIAVPDGAAVTDATHGFARRLEHVVRRHPEQWHVLWPACVEDAEPGPAGPEIPHKEPRTK